jgi:hypothetical protein
MILTRIDRIQLVPCCPFFCLEIRLNFQLHPAETTPFDPVLNIAANSPIGKAVEDQALSFHQ